MTTNLRAKILEAPVVAALVTTAAGVRFAENDLVRAKRRASFRSEETSPIYLAFYAVSRPLVRTASPAEAYI